MPRESSWGASSILEQVNIGQHPSPPRWVTAEWESFHVENSFIFEAMLIVHYCSNHDGLESHTFVWFACICGMICLVANSVTMWILLMETFTETWLYCFFLLILVQLFSFFFYLELQVWFMPVIQCLHLICGSCYAVSNWHYQEIKIVY